MTATPHEYDSDTGVRNETPLTLLGQFIGYQGTPGSSPGIYVALQITSADPETLPKVPGSPTLSGSLTSRTVSSLSWAAFPDDISVPPVLEWVVERRSSTDGGLNYGPWAEISASPIAAGTLTVGETGLPTGTPEIIFEYRVRGDNVNGEGKWSNSKGMQHNGTITSQPLAPTNLLRGNISQNGADLSWSIVGDGSVTKQGIFDDDVLIIDNVPATATTYSIGIFSPSTTYNGINVRRWNGQWSPASNPVSFTTLDAPAPTFTMLMGVSSSDNDHGGNDDWEGWRVYQRSEMLQRANQVAAQGSGSPSKPLFLAYSVDGPPLGSSGPTAGDVNSAVSTLDYTQIYDYVLSELNSFYYNNTASTPSSRWGIKLYWSNGNENSDKGLLAPAPANGASHTATQIANFVVSQKALYDAVHYAPGGIRRFPDAYAGSNPTQEQERKGWVQGWLHASARYHDFVMWSMYPPGRGVNDPQLARNPRLDWPTFNESQRQNLQQGYLIRCFYRTYQAQRQARIDLGQNPDTGSFRIAIGCGETGQASDPDDRSQRPYFAVHGLAGAMWILANQYGLDMDFACWWDNKTSDTSPHNILTDEPPNSDHLAFGNGATIGNNATATNPTTAVAWKNWQSYDKRQPGSTQPSQWAGNPKSSWVFTGTQV